MIKKSLFIWLLIIPLAILNGGLRQYILEPALGEKYAMPISGLILCLLVFLISLIFIPKLGKGTRNTYFKMGLLWMIATIIFEFTLGIILKKDEILEKAIEVINSK